MAESSHTRRSRAYLKTGAVIINFIEAFKNEVSHEPTWGEIIARLNEIGHPTKRGGPWRASSAQTALIRYCEVKDRTYPLTRNRMKKSKLFDPDPTTKEITLNLTIKLQITADEDINFIIE
tara:strand:+ start:366 stop:728 length:363 start_codon:yes stop_codon:yes gene_type:complete